MRRRVKITLSGPTVGDWLDDRGYPDTVRISPVLAPGIILAGYDRGRMIGADDRPVVEVELVRVGDRLDAALELVMFAVGVIKELDPRLAAADLALVEVGP